jgi:hypothetical protein
MELRIDLLAVSGEQRSAKNRPLHSMFVVHQPVDKHVAEARYLSC